MSGLSAGVAFEAPWFVSLIQQIPCWCSLVVVAWVLDLDLVFWLVCGASSVFFCIHYSYAAGLTGVEEAVAGQSKLRPFAAYVVAIPWEPGTTM